MYGSNIKEYYNPNPFVEQPILELMGRGRLLYNTYVDPTAGWYNIRNKRNLCRTDKADGQFKCIHVENGDLQETVETRVGTGSPIYYNYYNALNTKNFTSDDISKYIYLTDLQGNGNNNDICIIDPNFTKAETKQCYLVDDNGNVSKTDMKKLYPRTSTGFVSNPYVGFTIVEVGDVIYTQDQVLKVYDNIKTFDQVSEFLAIYAGVDSFLWDLPNSKLIIFKSKSQYRHTSNTHKVIHGNGKFYAEYY